MKGRSRPITGYVELSRQIIRLLGKGYVEEQALPALEQLINDLESGGREVAGQV